ncbi:sulfotransferase family 2 domain-containing protein [Lewinella sp. LCG006]|uniref:sulfotransferase family 2 domain-containing protein n=1 Tax=Lewinella sp. LCG006 TaxID=3231911 RepID=UPI0034603511
MFDFLKKQKSDTALELISIHIPKTAGTSFRNTLKQVYGEEKVVRLDINRSSKEVRINELLFTKPELPSKIKVIHGHFSIANLKQCFFIDECTPMITWLRDPVDRVISNYFYLCKRLAEELEEEKKGLNILSKLQRSLIEYARDEISRNRISKFLSGAQLTDFIFVGIQEHYDADLADLANLLDWPTAKAFLHNVTGSSYEVDKGTRDEIARLNTLDMDLYHTALEMRENRLSKMCN